MLTIGSYLTLSAVNQADKANEQGFSQTYIMQKPRDFGDFVGKSPREAYLA